MANEMHEYNQSIQNENRTKSKRKTSAPNSSVKKAQKKKAQTPWKKKKGGRPHRIKSRLITLHLSFASSDASFAAPAKKEAHLTTIPLTVFFKSKISPLASTSICLDKSPSATAFVTFAMDRT
jgi:hypothetical protein